MRIRSLFAFALAYLVVNVFQGPNSFKQLVEGNVSSYCKLSPIFKKGHKDNQS